MQDINSARQYYYHELEKMNVMLFMLKQLHYAEMIFLKNKFK